MSINNILIFGASSAIANAIARRYAIAQANFFLAGKDQAKLEVSGNSITAAGGNVCGQFCYNFNQSESHQLALDQAMTALGTIDLILIAHGSLPDQLTCESDLDALQHTIASNFTSSIMIATAAAAMLDTQGRGTLAVISSVAGDRGRKSNYYYGACKSAVDTVLEGMHGRFLKSEVSIVNIKPGLIDTPMTAHLTKGLLWATADSIAPSIVKGISRGKPVIYAPPYWRYIMWIIKILPRWILGRLSI